MTANLPQNERKSNLHVVIPANTSLSDTNSPFIGKTASEWLEQALTMDVPRQLFGEFWIEGELCVLFASTNVGKSIFSVQMADAISRGISSNPFFVQGGARKVLYFDYELSVRQFAKRYSEQENGRYVNPFKFHPNFIRFEKQKAAPPEGMPMADFYIESIEAKVKEHSANVVIIDNITWINSRLEKAADAGPFMQRLNDLKRENDLSILLIAHTPKRGVLQPITLNDLAGSAMLMNFMDSAFAIGWSTRHPKFRYVKQIKVRDGEHLYNDQNVIVCTLDKVGNWLGYTFEDFDSEKPHIKLRNDGDDNVLKNKIIEEWETNQTTYREIAKKLGTSKTKVSRVIKEWRQNAPKPTEEVPF